MYWGAANQAGEDNRNVARMGVLLAGLPVEVPGATVNRLCGSGMEAIAAAARAIAAGELDICIAGGIESMTRAPFVLPRADEPVPARGRGGRHPAGLAAGQPADGGAVPADQPGRDGRERRRPLRRRAGPGRTSSRWPATSKAAAAAARAGSLTRSCRSTAPHGEVTADEGIKPGLTLAELAAKRPAFRKNGTVTGGNSSPLNDGAAGLLLMSEQAAAAAGAEPLARYVGTAAAGVHPDYMGIGPVPAHGQGPGPGRLGASMTWTWPRSTRRSRPRPWPSWTS